MSFSTVLTCHDGTRFVLDRSELVFLRASADHPLDVATEAVDAPTAAALALACGSRNRWTLRRFLLHAAQEGGFTVGIAVSAPAQRRPRHDTRTSYVVSRAGE